MIGDSKVSEMAPLSETYCLEKETGIKQRNATQYNGYKISFVAVQKSPRAWNN